MLRSFINLTIVEIIHKLHKIAHKLHETCVVQTSTTSQNHFHTHNCSNAFEARTKQKQPKEIIVRTCGDADNDDVDTNKLGDVALSLFKTLTFGKLKIK